jgi:hypothetical protein
MSDHWYPRTTPIARKEYHCQASEFVRDAWNDADIATLPEKERNAFELAKSHNFRILKGERYIKQISIYDGSYGIFRGIPDMVDMCHKYELFPDV